MASLSLTIRSNRLNKDGQTNVLVRVSKQGKIAYIPTSVYIDPSNWDNVSQQVYGLKNASMLNNNINLFLSTARLRLMDLEVQGKDTSLSVTELRDMLSPDYDPNAERERRRKKTLFVAVFDKFVDTKSTKGTKTIYKRTMEVIRAYDKEIDLKTFNDINLDWLLGFQKERRKVENANTVAIHLRNIRAVFNYAIDNDITTKYPFRKMEIKYETAHTTPMPLEDLREMWTAPVEEWQQQWVDLAKLVFLFIGINMADLSQLKYIDSFGYINYNRAKTSTPYRIKVEPEAIEIINRWRGSDHLLSHFDNRASYKSADKSMVHAVKCIGLDEPPSKGGQGNKATIKRSDKKAVSENSRFGYFCLYSLRKAWATIAFNDLGIPMEVISMALGHSDGKGLSVTQRYVHFNSKLIDDANRKVIDWVLYNKKGEE